MRTKLKKRKKAKKRDHAKAVAARIRCFFERMKGRSKKRDKTPPSQLKELNVWQKT